MEIGKRSVIARGCRVGMDRQSIEDFQGRQKYSLWYHIDEHISLNVVVQSLSPVHLFATPWTAARQASLPFTISRSLLILMFIELMMPHNYLVLCHPLLLLSSIFPSIREYIIHLSKILDNSNDHIINCPNPTTAESESDYYG